MAHTMDDFPIPLPHGTYELRIAELHRHWQRQDLIAEIKLVDEEAELANLRGQWRRMQARDEITIGPTYRHFHQTNYGTAFTPICGPVLLLPKFFKELNYE